MMISIAHAQTAGQSGSGESFTTLIMLVAIFAIFYFLVIRPQQKKQKELRGLIEALKKGDEVLTAGGIVGRIVDLDEQFIDLEIAPNTTIKMQKNTVINLLPKGSYKGGNGGSGKNQK
ncbi:preprotein translocase subunit YajC [Ostreibacterium oceani]|uniref:Sec translocon accessory complex subunit YajC n=1 Tax=Ostreibacterium oceani TaxID=2654998 RepID=A0A6N7EX19_9GAMM|nr:preprotein translocase subunit YajC [Ostreibacterium oceani]MPV85677.1 preprotein translocase subunit YajC [Ostreibacterium oceani]